MAGCANVCVLRNYASVSSLSLVFRATRSWRSMAARVDRKTGLNLARSIFFTFFLNDLPHACPESRLESSDFYCFPCAKRRSSTCVVIKLQMQEWGEKGCDMGLQIPQQQYKPQFSSDGL